MKDICRDCPTIERSLLDMQLLPGEELRRGPEGYAGLIQKDGEPRRIPVASLSRRGSCGGAGTLLGAVHDPGEHEADSVRRLHRAALRGARRTSQTRLRHRECALRVRRHRHAYCVHGATLLWILHNLAREDDIAKNHVPPTSAACRWNTPTTGEAYDDMKPVAYMPITKDEASKR